MKEHRQDAWTQEEDALLTEIVIDHIRTESTQSKAFEVVGKQLSRTASACGFRWNSYVRKLHNETIALAKKERTKQSPTTAPIQEGKLKNLPVKRVGMPLSQSFNVILSYLQSIYDDAIRSKQLQMETKKYQEKIAELELQLHVVSNEKVKIHKQAQKIEADYESLLIIIERARKLVLQEEKNKIFNK